MGKRGDLVKGDTGGARAGPLCILTLYVVKNYDFVPEK
jgi:hypothetical protein